MDKFEYKVISIFETNPRDIEGILNSWGEAFWELVSIRGNYNYILKRKVKKYNDNEVKNN